MAGKKYGEPVGAGKPRMEKKMVSQPKPKANPRPARRPGK